MTNETRSESSAIDDVVQHVMRAYAAAQGLRAAGYLVSEIAEHVYRRLPNVPESSAESFASMITSQWAAYESIFGLSEEQVRGKSHDEVIADTMDAMDVFVSREGGRKGAFADHKSGIRPVLPPPKPSSVESAIDKLFAETASPFPNQAPAAKCVVILRSGRELQGSLSKHDGGLRMMMPIASSPGKMAMMELFFDYDDVAAVAVERDVVAAAPPRIVI